MSELILICLFATAAGIIFRQSKIVALILMAIMWLLWGWSGDNGDYFQYQTNYRDVLALMESDYEMGFKLLMFYGQQLGLSFQQFMQVISFLTIVLWGNFIFRVTNYPALFFAILLWVFFPLDYVLMRNTFAFSIVLQGLLFIRRDRSWAYIGFVLCVVLAAQIHITSYFYLIFLGIPIASKLSTTRLLFLICGAIVIGFYFRGLLTSRLGDSTEGRTDMYEGSMVTMVFYAAIQIINTIFVARVVDDAVEENPKLASFELVKICNLLLLTVIPMYSISAITIRLLRNFIFADMAFLLNILLMKNMSRIYLVVGALILLFVFQHFVLLVADDTIVAMFKYNLIWH